MAEQIIALFSSDARELYKADVYRALSLPDGYVLQFRYPSKYVERGLLSANDSLKGQKGIIFYVSGNDPSIETQDRNLTYTSIRSVVIRDIMPDAHLDAIHFYLELGSFVEATPHPRTAGELLPPTCLVSKLSVESGPNDKWIQRVDAVKAGFPALPFFFIDSVKQGNTQITPKYSEADKSSSFPLYDESDYQLRIVMYDPLPGKTGLTVENGSADVTLLIPAGHSIGADSDTKVFKLQTHSLPRQQVSTFVRISGVNYEHLTSPTGIADYRVVLEWTVAKKRARIWQFGGLSMLAALGVGLAKLATDDLEAWQWSIANVVCAIAGTISIGVAAAWSYVLFNKK